MSGEVLVRQGVPLTLRLSKGEWNTFFNGLLAFVIVLVAVAPETHAQFTRDSDQMMKGWIRFAVREYTALGPFTPDSGKMMEGSCTAGTAEPIFLTNGSASPLRYLENMSVDCTFTLQCYSGGCGAGAISIGVSVTLSRKPSLPFRVFGIACPSSADTICLTPVVGSGTWRLQGEP